MRDDQPAEEAVAADGSSMRAQMEAMQRLLREQAQQLQQLRASPAHSPQPSPHLSPQQAQRSIAAAAAAAPEQQSRFARKEPRAQDLREYDGAAGAKLDEWLDELGAAVDLFYLNEREAVDFGTSRLRGAARQWWNGLGASRTSIDGASALARALRARFQPITTERVAREQMRALRQNSRHVNDYIADFQRLRALLPDMGEADALFAFESGLSPAIALELRKQGVSSLQEAIAMAARVGGLLQAPAAPHGRTAAVNQMDIDDGGGASLDERIQRAVLNAMHARGNSGMGAKTQTHRGYTQERQQSGGGARGGSQGGRGGRFGQRGPPVVPGVPEAVVRQRLDAQQCVRCGGDGHRSPACPNAISASGN